MVDENGEYCVTRKLPEKVGFVDDTVAEVGLTTTVALVPSSGYSTESMAAAPKSWWNSRVIEPVCSPAIDVRKVAPKAVVS
jgi:hypothetical protein